MRELEMLHVSLEASLTDTMSAARLYAAKFNVFKYLWTQRKEDVLRASLTDVRASQLATAQGYAILETFKKEVSEICCRTDFV